MMEKFLLMLTSIIFISSLSKAQEVIDITGPSLENTIDWVSINIVNVSSKNGEQYRQKFTYDFENQCQCRLIIKNLDKENNLVTKEYTFHFGDIDSEKIFADDGNELSEITLATYKNKKNILLLFNEIESIENNFTIYDRDYENGQRLAKALKHIARLCKK